jgi:glyoxylase-like metal-dependent hydrolase (beta-lactamase superfamily II)
VAEVQHIRLGYNNVYLVTTGEGGVLVDTGPDYRGAWDELGGALSRRPDMVVATHGHHDHAGLSRAWQAAGVRVALGHLDAHFGSHAALGAHDELAHMREWVASCGAPGDMRDEAIAQLERRAAVGQAAQRDYPPPGSRPRWPTGLRFTPFAAEVAIKRDVRVLGLDAMLAPGHTPGNLVVVEPTEGWLFSGDTLLPEITPTPAVQVDPAAVHGWRFQSLLTFRRSLVRLAERPYARCFPGHGEPFDDVAARIAENLAAIDERSERVTDAMPPGRPMSLWAVAELMYPRAVRRRFWQILPTVQGHLDILVDAGTAVLTGGCYVRR